MVDEGEGDAGGGADGAAGEDEGGVGDARVDGEEMSEAGECTGIGGREARLEEEGFMGGDGETELGADDVGELGDGVGERSDVRVGDGGRSAGGSGGRKVRSARVVSSWMSEIRSEGQRGERWAARVRAKVMPKLCWAIASPWSVASVWR